MEKQFNNYQEFLDAFKTICESAEFLKHVPTVHLTREKATPSFTVYLREYTRKMKYWQRSSLHVFVPLKLFYQSGKIVLDEKKRTITIPGVLTIRKARGDTPEIVESDFKYRDEDLVEFLKKNPASVESLTIALPQINHYGNLGEKIKTEKPDEVLAKIFQLEKTNFSVCRAIAEGEKIEDIQSGYAFHRNSLSLFVKSLTPKQALDLGIERTAGASKIAKAIFGLSSCTDLLKHLKTEAKYHAVQEVKNFYTDINGKLDHFNYKKALEHIINSDQNFAPLRENQLKHTSQSVRSLEKILETSWYEIKESVDSIVMYELATALPEFNNLQKNLVRWAKKHSPQERAKKFHDYFVAALNRVDIKAQALLVEASLQNQMLPSVNYDTSLVPDGWNISIPNTVYDVRELGKKQHHCIYTSAYHRSVEKKKAFIFALWREKISDGVTCFGTKPNELKIYGLQNRKPTDEERQLAQSIFATMGWEDHGGD